MVFLKGNVMDMEIKDVVLVVDVNDDEDGGEGGYSVYEMVKGEKRVSVLFPSHDTLPV